jgi:hypothetical protein
MKRMLRPWHVDKLADSLAHHLPSERVCRNRHLNFASRHLERTRPSRIEPRLRSPDHRLLPLRRRPARLMTSRQHRVDQPANSLRRGRLQQDPVPLCHPENPRTPQVIAVVLLLRPLSYCKRRRRPKRWHLPRQCHLDPFPLSNLPPPSLLVHRLTSRKSTMSSFNTSSMRSPTSSTR